jgi:hypothetical protein
MLDVLVSGSLSFRHLQYLTILVLFLIHMSTRLLFGYPLSVAHPIMGKPDLPLLNFALSHLLLFQVPSLFELDPIEIDVRAHVLGYLLVALLRFLEELHRRIEPLIVLVGPAPVPALRVRVGKLQVE